jgi:hypothetical protein
MHHKCLLLDPAIMVERYMGFKTSSDGGGVDGGELRGQGFTYAQEGEKEEEGVRRGQGDATCMPLGAHLALLL